MPRYWLLTSSFYGTWLPGDPRGFVGRVRDLRSNDAPTTVRIEHDIPGTPYDEEMPGLEHASAERMKGPPIYIERGHAKVLLTQFLETAEHRKWDLLAVAIMFNHCHLVVGTPASACPEKILGDFKAYGSRALNGQYGVPLSKTWWTSRGSKRTLWDDDAIAAAVYYLLYKQPNPLVLWSKYGVVIASEE